MTKKIKKIEYIFCVVIIMLILMILGLFFIYNSVISSEDIALDLIRNTNEQIGYNENEFLATMKLITYSRMLIGVILSLVGGLGTLLSIHWGYMMLYLKKSDEN